MFCSFVGSGIFTNRIKIVKFTDEETEETLLGNLKFKLSLFFFFFFSLFFNYQKTKNKNKKSELDVAL